MRGCHGKDIQRHRKVTLAAYEYGHRRSRELLNRLPAEASFEEIQYQVYVLDEISRGSEEIDRGEGVEHEEVKRRLAKWLDE